MPEPGHGRTAIAATDVDEAAACAAARTTCVVIDRPDRAFVRVAGRDPVRMVNGLLTNDIAATDAGHAVRAAMLTPKGRMLAETRVIRRADDLLIETDVTAIANVLATLTKYVPPLFAKGEDVSGTLRVVTLLGPASLATLARVLGDATVALVRDTGAAEARFEDRPVIALRTDRADSAGADLVVPADMRDAIMQGLAAAGAVHGGPDTLEILRIEAGEPRWGAELDESVIPLEAGLEDAMISTTKGCYTGQEVIIRILHRGHVNRHLRGILLDDAPVPAPGTELFREDAAKPMGQVTSACASPRMGRTIALGYVRREVEPGSTLRLGEPGGRPARIVALPFTTGAA